MNIFICTDSRGFVTPTHRDYCLAWTNLVKERLPNHNVELAAWDYAIYTFDRMLKLVDSKPKPDLIISQLGQNEMCSGPYLHKMTWAKEIPESYNTRIRREGEGYYDTHVDCQPWIRDCLKEMSNKYVHLAILPTRIYPDTERLEELRQILRDCCPNIIEIVEPQTTISFDTEHYGFDGHEIIAKRVIDWIFNYGAKP